MADSPSPHFPFADLLGFTVRREGDGHGSAQITLDPQRHFNPQGVAHGGVAYALADTAMGVALYGTMRNGQMCATINITINYIAPIRGGELICRARVVNGGKRVAHLAADIFNGEQLVANATGSFAIFTPA